MMRFLFLFLITAFFAFSCSQKVFYSKNYRDWKDSLPPDSSLLDYTVYLVGDAGEPARYGETAFTLEEPVFKILKQQIQQDSNSALIFLGDNIYYSGLPEEGAFDRKIAEDRINEQLKITDDYKGKVFFIAGNHDWNAMKAGGWDAVKRQELYIEKRLGRGNSFIPDNGCPGPYKITLKDNIVMLAMDSQWWLHNHIKPYGKGSDCEAEDESDVITQVDDYIKSNLNKNILFVAHHPLYSNGNHGGYYSFMDYLFPLRLIRNYLYLPLPLLGALYPLHRKFGGTAQDIVHYKYQRYKNSILNVSNTHPRFIYAAGHDHNLQYHVKDSLYHIVSGSGSKVNAVRGGNDATFTIKSKGFSKLKYYSNNEVWVEYWVPDIFNGSPVLAFRSMVYNKKSARPDLTCGLSNTDYTDSSMVVTAGNKYKRSKIGQILFGQHYSQEWATPVKVPLIDLKTVEGGLLPYAVGGVDKLLTLKLKNPEDKEFILRSISNNVVRSNTLDTRSNYIQELVNSQVAAQHPYGALIVPPLAKAVNVLHTKPEIVIIPNDSCLGPYGEQFGNMLAYYEENPDFPHSDKANMGNASEIFGTEKLYIELDNSHKNRIDESLFLKTRLFDMLLGDWNRHERQYRWSKVKANEGLSIFQPIAEDRNRAFFAFEGVLPWMVSRKWGMRNLKNFDHEIKDPSGLNFMAGKMDRRLLSSLSRQYWIEAADTIKALLTDSVIDSAIKNWPEQIKKLHGDEIAAKLKSRRDNLKNTANEYYKTLAKYVDIYGSKQDEEIIISRLNNDEVKIIIKNIDEHPDTREILYERIFTGSETKEIRIYGQGGNDFFKIEGIVKKSIPIRIIGGIDKDSIVDNSGVNGLSRNTIIYDSKKDNFISHSHETSLKLSSHSMVHDQEENNIRTNEVLPQVNLDFNKDDGLFLGAGVLFKKYKFRKVPFAAEHKLNFSISSVTGSKKLDYSGTIKDVLPGIDFYGTASGYLPAYVMNYYGYGNESINNASLQENASRISVKYWSANPSLTKNLTRFLKIGLGPQYKWYKLEQNEKFAEDALAENDLLSSNHYLGMRGFLWVGAVDNTINPSRGIIFTAESSLNRKMNNDARVYTQTLSEFKFYITPNLPFQLTFAGRIGGAFNTGTFYFYQANMLGTGEMFGNYSNLRGFRKTRFIGDQSLYQNLETRIELFRFKLFVFPGKCGLVGFLDNGRVWVRDELSRNWHTSVGIGPWVNIFNKFIFTSTVVHSKEDTMINFKLGHFF